MSAVMSRRCDQCGAEERDPRTWVRICARQPAFQQYSAGSIDPPPAAAVVIKGYRYHEFLDVDLCSPACAGAWLFGVKP